MRILDTFVSEPRACSYLPSETASLEYRILLDVSPEDYEQMLCRGWRRFGPVYFRPAPCPHCSECVSIRLPVDRFTPSRSQRRARNRSVGLRVELGEPRVDRQRLSLYHRWHEKQAGARGWTPDSMDPERYFHEFAFPHPVARELAFFDDAASEGQSPRLVAVSLVDLTPAALSAVYTYHDPEYARLSLGTASVLTQVELARQLGKSHLYLGYRVLGCASSEYKAKFRPHELLRGWPGGDEAPRWEAVD